MNRRGVTAIAPWALGVLWAVAGCVARDVGYDDVRRTTAERIGKDVRWHEMDGGGAVAKRTHDILTRALTADSAVEVALLNNSGLEAAFEDLGIARAEIVRALALPNPSAEAAVRFHPSSRPEITLRALESVSQLVLLPLRNGVARSEFEAVKAKVTGVVLDVAFETRRAFYEYQAAAQVLDLRRSVLTATLGSYEAAERIHEAGNSSDLTLANERALYEESRILQTRAETAAVTAREKMQALLGLPTKDGDWKIESRIPEPPTAEPPTENLEARALTKSLDLELVKYRLEAAAKRANLSRVEGLLPDLRVGAEAEREEHWALGPAAAISIPLFYQGQGEVGAALADVRRQRALYAALGARIRSAARSARARLAAARTNANYYKTVLVPLRLQIVNDTELEYNAMSVGVFQLLQAKRDQIETARAYVEQLRDYWTARCDADELAAGRLERTSIGSETRGPIEDGARPNRTGEP